MKFNRKKLFDALRATVFHGGFTPSQVHGIERLLTVFEDSYATKWEDAHGESMTLQLVSYCFATSYWETAHRMMPVYETLAKTPSQAKARLESWYKKKRPKVTPYWRDGWFGRGDVQITHEYNYVKATQLLARMGIIADLMTNPELAMDPINSAHILFAGSYEGMFTGKALPDYIDADDVGEFEDYTHARYVINGRDKAQAIARIAQDFEAAFKSALIIEPLEEPGVYEHVEKDDNVVTKSTTVMASAGKAATAIGGVLGAFSGLNPWIAGLLILLVAGAFVWVVRERKLKSWLGV